MTPRQPAIQPASQLWLCRCRFSVLSDVLSGMLHALHIRICYARVGKFRMMLRDYIDEGDFIICPQAELRV
eukprot:COSAG06_NODE_45068_length_358_cov_0.490347_1_plen_70_part_10